MKLKAMSPPPPPPPPSSHKFLSTSSINSSSGGGGGGGSSNNSPKASRRPRPSKLPLVSSYEQQPKQSGDTLSKEAGGDSTWPTLIQSPVFSQRRRPMKRSKSPTSPASAATPGHLRGGVAETRKLSNNSNFTSTVELRFTKRKRSTSTVVRIICYTSIGFPFIYNVL